MTTLSTLLDAYRKAYAAAEQYADYAEEMYAIAEYIVAHAAEYAERERLERAVIEAYEHYNLHDINVYEYRNVADHLVAWLVEHAQPILDDVARADDESARMP